MGTKWYSTVHLQWGLRRTWLDLPLKSRADAWWCSGWLCDLIGMGYPENQMVQWDSMTCKSDGIWRSMVYIIHPLRFNSRWGPMYRIGLRRFYLSIFLVSERCPKKMLTKVSHAFETRSHSAERTAKELSFGSSGSARAPAKRIVQPTVSHAKKISWVMDLNIKTTIGNEW